MNSHTHKKKAEKAKSQANEAKENRRHLYLSEWDSVDVNGYTNRKHETGIRMKGRNIWDKY